MKLSVICPLRAGFGHDRNAAWTTARVAAFAGDETEIIFGNSPDGLFNKAAAVNDGASRATGDVLALLDADAMLTRYAVLRAVQIVADGGWCRPFHTVWALTEHYSAQVLEYPPSLDVPIDESEVAHKMPLNPGMAVFLSRRDFEDIGGMDPRFVGWGGEDESWGFQCGTLLGQSQRVEAVCGHLWHESVEQLHQPHFKQNVELRNRYSEIYARRNKGAMRALIAERGQ